MHVTHLSLVDFRSYAGAEVALDAGATAFVGPNGQGKTNLVEAVGYASTLGSHRVPTDAPLVRAGAPRAVVRVAVARGGRSSLVELEITPGRANRARLNRSPLPRARDVLGTLRTVLFAPEDLALVKGDPEGRRRFLDDLLVQLAPRLAGVRADYDRVLRQRNALLRQAAGGRSGRRRGAREDDLVLPTLEVWDAQLARTGAELLHARRHLVSRLAPHVAAAYRDVSGGAGSARVGYRSTLPAADSPDLPGDPADVPGREDLTAALLAELAVRRGEELERGVSLVGPHRDDVVLDLAGMPAKGYASHGESWSFALALRLGSYHLLRGDPGPDGSTVAGDADGEPVLVLDDVFAELDTGRRSRLAALVAPAEQVLLTAAVEADVPAELAGVRMRVSEGEVHRA